jgi:hypothetical protein
VAYITRKRFISNTKDLMPAERFGIEVVTPGAFLREIE